MRALTLRWRWLAQRRQLLTRSSSTTSYGSTATDARRVYRQAAAPDASGMRVYDRARLCTTVSATRPTSSENVKCMSPAGTAVERRQRRTEIIVVNITIIVIIIIISNSRRICGRNGKLFVWIVIMLFGTRARGVCAFVCARACTHMCVCVCVCVRAWYDERVGKAGWGWGPDRTRYACVRRRVSSLGTPPPRVYNIRCWLPVRRC
uniref:Uncharacterized protein n=1 Tax=Sipha flava TaxID=143950 RepID=A0A2S2QLV7_9HEMI